MKNVGDANAGPQMEVQLRLRGAVAAGLINAALERDMRPVDLLAVVIEAICTENLFAAVIDE